MKKLLPILIVFCICSGPFAWATPIPISVIQVFGSNFSGADYPENTINDNLDDHWAGTLIGPSG